MVTYVPHGCSNDSLHIFRAVKTARLAVCMILNLSSTRGYLDLFAEEIQLVLDRQREMIACAV